MNILDEMRDRIKSSNDIVAVVSEHVKLTKQGDWWVGCCPFHDEKTPSFKVNEKTQQYCCFGCGAGRKDSGIGSDVISFIQEIKNLTFQDACEDLAKRAGIEIEEGIPSPEVFRAKEIATEHNRRYHKNLWKSNDQLSVTALSYLKKRGLDNKIITDFRLGLVPVDELLYRNDISKIAGRIAFPIVEVKDKDAKTLGMAYRQPSDTTSLPKYKNDPTSLCFQKGSLLFGLNLAANSIRQQDYGIFTECYFGTMVLHQYGITNTVSTMSNMISESQIQLAKRYSKNWIFLYDGDTAGYDGMIRALPLMLSNDLIPYACVLPISLDPDEMMIKLGDKESFINWLDTNKKPLLDIFIYDLLHSYDTKVNSLKIEVLNKLEPIVSSLKDNKLTIARSYINQRLNLNY